MHNSEEEQPELKNLTPWQQENMKYQKDKGDTPNWLPSVIQTEDIQKEKENEETEQAEEQIEEKKDSSQQKSEKPVIKEVHYQSFTNKLPNLKKERSKRLKRRLAVVLSIFGIATLCAIYYISPFSKVGKIIVSGNQLVSENAIVKASGIQIREELWSQYFERDKDQQKILKALPRIKSASIHLNGVNQLQIVVQEYQTVAYSVEAEKNYPILENGKILSEVVTQTEGELPLLEDFTDQKLIRKFLKEYNKLSKEITNSVSEICSTPSESNPERITLYMNDGNRVISTIEGFASKMNYYPQVSSEIDGNGVIDMEVGIFSYPYGNDEKNNE